MKALCAGITTKFNAGGDLYTNLGGRFYLLEAPDDVSMPYGIYWPRGIESEWQFDEDKERVTVGIELYSDSRAAEQILDLFENCKSMFDECVLTVSGYRHVHMHRTIASLDKIEDPTTGELMWLWDVEYDVLLEKL